jgi:hypothetical protein
MGRARPCWPLQPALTAATHTPPTVFDPHAGPLACRWFYTLMVLSTALFDKPAFKNLVCNGLVLAADGKKMSKRLKNYPVGGWVGDWVGGRAGGGLFGCAGRHRNRRRFECPIKPSLFTYCPPGTTCVHL